MTEPISADVLAELERRRAEHGDWRVLTGDERAAKYACGPTHYVSATPPEWTPDPGAAYACIGVWDDHGFTTEAIAALIADSHNALPALLTTARRYAELLEGVERLAAKWDAHAERLEDDVEAGDVGWQVIQCSRARELRSAAAALRQLKEQTQ